jgi:hypothetical protein
MQRNEVHVSACKGMHVPPDLPCPLLYIKAQISRHTDPHTRGILTQTCARLGWQARLTTVTRMGSVLKTAEALSSRIPYRTAQHTSTNSDRKQRQTSIIPRLAWRAQANLSTHPNRHSNTCTGHKPHCFLASGSGPGEAAPQHARCCLQHASSNVQQ